MDWKGAKYESMVSSLREYSPIFVTHRRDMSSSCAASISTPPLSSHVLSSASVQGLCSRLGKYCAPGWQTRSRLANALQAGQNALWANVLQAGANGDSVL
jgi:hypothetical protein